MPLLLGRFSKYLATSLAASASISGQSGSWILQACAPNTISKGILVSALILTLIRVPAKLATDCTDVASLRIFDVTICGLWVLMLGIVTARMQKNGHDFGITNECRVLFVVILITASVKMAILISQSAADQIDAVMPDDRGLLISSLLLNLVMVWYPILLTLAVPNDMQPVQSTERKRTLNLATTLDENSDLLKLLDDPAGLGLFRQFLVNEFSAENLSCYFDLLKIERSGSWTSLDLDFRQIYEHYVKPGSVNEVNISAVLKVGTASCSPIENL